MATFTKRPSGRWQATVRRRNHPTKAKTFPSKQAAEKWATEIERQLAPRHVDPDTIQAILDRYEREVLPHKKGKSQERSRLRLLGGFFGITSVCDLTPAMVCAYAIERSKTVGSDTVRRDLALFSSVLEWARTMWGYNVTNAVQVATRQLRKTKLYQRPVTRERRLQPGEYRRLLKASSPRLRKIIRLILETGLRRGEVARLRPAHLTKDGLWVADDKTGKTTLVPVSRRARRIVGSLGEGGFGVRPDSITQAFERAVKRAGLADLRVHDLRHECTSRLFEKGLGIEEVAVITRHSDWRSLKIYVQPRNEAISRKLG